MSAAATAGPPPDDRASALHRGGLVGGQSHLKGTMPEGIHDVRGGRVIPHIDDLVAVRPDVNPYQSIGKILSEAEIYAKQADTHLDFRRPDLALQEYIKASIIAVEVIPRHKEYPELKHSNYQRAWNGLQKRINSQHSKFEEVKKSIKADNLQSGVQPLSKGGRAQDAQVNGFNDLAIRLKGLETMNTPTSLEPESIGLNKSRPFAVVAPDDARDDSPSRKLPPPVQRKPTALHGNTIKPSGPLAEKPSSPINEDLAARFARLRGAESPLPVQDPRIRTRPIVPATLPGSSANGQIIPASNLPGLATDRPHGPRDMPRIPQVPIRPTKIPLGVDIPSMPRAPDAVYSPLRGTEGNSGINMPRHMPRNSYSGPIRTNSMSSMNGALRTSTTIDDRADYFSSIPKAKEATNTENGKPPRTTICPGIPDSTVISAEDLTKYLKRGSQDLRILLVDLRDREQFDDGHINVPSIICIEPVMLRRGISGEELCQSMVLSPDSEQKLFEQRHEFDLVVCYDQSSNTDAEVGSPIPSGSSALKDFSLAVYDYAYDERQLQRRPMLLVGGLDAWIDLMGYQALVTSNTANSGPRQQIATSKKPPTPSFLPRGNHTARRKTYESRPLTKEEESKWDETLKDEEVPSPSVVRGSSPTDSWSYTKTTADFFRRFPDVAQQESMTIPRNADISYQKPTQPGPIARPLDSSHHEELNALMPKPPTRPSPAVPRPSYRGTSEKNEHSDAQQDNGSSGSAFGPPVVQTLGEEVGIKGRTGLANFGNTCYMNSVLQSLSATPLLAWFLMSGDYQKPEFKAPRKAGENTDPPQLMTRNLANLLRHLWSGQFTYVTPKTFKKYVSEISQSKSLGEDFGGDDQQDGAEFLIFVLQILDDELNNNRHRPKGKEPSDQEMSRLMQMPAVHSAILEWNRFFMYESSAINGLFGGQTTVTMTCKHCKHSVKRWDAWLNLPVAILDSQTPQTLDDALRRNFMSDDINDYKCDRCHRLGSTKSELVSRCPTYMIVDLKRATKKKIQTQVTFPLDNLNMTPYFVPTSGADIARLSPDEYKQYIGPFMYQCYAVIQHRGTSVNSGHYWALVRDLKQNQWWEMNDRSVTKANAVQTQSNLSYVLFYRRM